MNDTILRRSAVGLASAGIVVATYLTVTHYAHVNPICTAHSDGCVTVAKSSYSVLGPLPVSLWGLGAYLCLIIVSLQQGFYVRLAAFFITFVGFCFSIYLTYLEVNVIHAICEWCVSSAIIMTVSFFIALIRFASELPVQPSTLRSTDEAEQ